MEEFGLGGGATQDDKEVEPTKALFRDKKLTRLWEKVLACFFVAFYYKWAQSKQITLFTYLFQAEKSGLNSEELTALQEEFRHHQRKV